MNLEINKQITCKDGRISTCNTLVIADDQTNSIEVRIWSFFKDFEKLKIGDILAIKGVVLHYLTNGAQILNNYKQSRVIKDPCFINEIDKMVFENLPLREIEIGSCNGSNSSTKSKLVTLKEGIQAATEALDNAVKEVYYFNCAVSITKLGKVNYYDSCENCKKKLIETDIGFFCERCSCYRDMSIPKYLSRVVLSDHTTTLKSTIMREEVGKEIFG